MKNLRTIKAAYRKLRALQNPTEDAKLALRLFDWIFDEENSLFISDILPQISDSKSRLLDDTYAYDAADWHWVMENPHKSGQYIMEKKKPSHTPSNWWKKVDRNEFEKDVIWTPDYFELFELLEGLESVSWVAVEDIFQNYRDWFKNRAAVEKFLSFYLPINYTDRIVISPIERREVIERQNVNKARLKEYFEKEFSAEFICEVKEKGESLWWLKKKE